MKVEIIMISTICLSVVVPAGHSWSVTDALWDAPADNDWFRTIVPGTKWCGPGDISDSYEDLGPERETDACCRAHDHCPDHIEAGQSKHNLTNDAFYTRLSCQCDDTFLACLRAAAAGERTADKVGHVYFNGIGTQCYRRDFPAVGCKKREGFLHRKCLEYEYDTNQTQRHQWFDVPAY